MDDNCGEWVECMVGVVVRRYIDLLILLKSDETGRGERMRRQLIIIYLTYINYMQTVVTMG